MPFKSKSYRPRKSPQSYIPGIQIKGNVQKADILVSFNMISLPLLTEGKSRSTCQKVPRSCLRSHFSLLTAPSTPMETLSLGTDSPKRRRMPPTNLDLLISLVVIQRLTPDTPRFEDSILSPIIGHPVRFIGYGRGYTEGSLGREGEFRGYQTLWVTSLRLLISS